MAKKIYALLVGINDYADEIGKLSGCINDVDRFHDYLKNNFANLEAAVLKNEQATRGNIIRQFSEHLGKAQANDVAVFQYSGHGARWAAAKEFKKDYPDGWDEGLVCFDSRQKSDNYDLADKELAILLAKVASNHPHLAVILDCCHSGSGTRDVDAFNQFKVRQTHEVKDERPLQSYLDGYYAKQLVIPTSKHILLAACEKTQKALEDPRQRSGVFMSTLLEVLDKTGSNISYAELFMRCRAAVRRRTENQNPQFEAYNNFNAYDSFLGQGTAEAGRRFYLVSKDKNDQLWKLKAGALQGLPTEPEKKVGLALYEKVKDKPATLIGTASTTQVGPNESVIDFQSDSATEYLAEVTSLPVAPIPVYLEGDEQGKEMLRQVLAKDDSIGVNLTDAAEGTRYALAAVNEEYWLKQRELNLNIQGVQGFLLQERTVAPQKYSEASAKQMLAIVKHVVQWERGLALQNHGTQMDPSLIDFTFTQTYDDGKEEKPQQGEFTLDFVKVLNEWKEIRGKIKARNRTREKLHFMLAYFSDNYGIQVCYNEEIPPNSGEITLWGEADNHYFHLPDEPEPINQSLENFKLIVSTEKVDGFLLNQDYLEIGKLWPSQKAAGMMEPRKKYKNEWFTKQLRIKVIRQINQVGAKDYALPGGQIVVKGHPAVKANLSLAAAKGPERGVGQDFDFYKAFEQKGMTMLNFAPLQRGTWGGNENILELTDIDSDSVKALATQPLEIELKVALAEDEYILPMVFDGQYALLGGEPSKDEHGNTHISISHIPEVPDSRRSVGKALKLYFFKTYLKRENVNQLCWVEYEADGKVTRHKSNLANKVGAAQNILLLVHGIIGDTEVMANGVKTCGLDQKFDLVLTYDYENLSTAIAETAEQLKQQLAANGLGENDNKKLTLLVHSMGGLVARSFIEQKGGNKVVDHLVMCGTPNHGSPFGKIETARKLMNILTPLAMTYVPVVVPFAGALLFRLGKITPTLKEMDPTSPFIEALNGSGDPGVRYTILAGDINEYKDPAERSFLQNLLAKVGKGFVFDLLFGGQAHDIAVSAESILGIDGSRNPVPTRKNVACHHLNYFVSEAGQKALQAVEW
jgi:pimeloyl-ACP methyl ester carboxylesterase